MGGSKGTVVPNLNGMRPTDPVVAGIDLQCAHKTGRTKQRCKNRVEPGYDVCFVHGGGMSQKAQLYRQRHPGRSGENSPLFQTGRYSKLLPDHLDRRYEAVRADPALLVLEEEMHLVDVRITDITTHLEQHESGAMWKEVKSALRDVRGLFRQKQYAAAYPLLEELKERVEGGVAESAAWDELGKWIDRRKQLAESERKRLVELQQYIPVSRVQVLISAIGGVIQQHVTDPVVLAAISQDLGRVLAGGVTGRPAPGGPAALTNGYGERD